MKHIKKILLSSLFIGLTACSEEDRTIKVEHEGAIDIKALEEEKEKYRKESEERKIKRAEREAKQAERRAEIAARRAAEAEAKGE